MLIPFRIPLSLLTSAFVAAIFSPAGAAKLDFTNFAGSYRSSFRVIYGDAPIESANLSVTILVPKNGQEARIRLRGYGTAAVGSVSQSASLFGNLTLKANRRIVADNALLAFFLRLPAKSVAQASTRLLRYTLTSAVPGIEGSFSVSYTLRHRKNLLTITGSGTTPNGPTTVQLVARKRGR